MRIAIVGAGAIGGENVMSAYENNPKADGDAFVRRRGENLAA